RAPRLCLRRQHREETRRRNGTGYGLAAQHEMAIHGYAFRPCWEYLFSFFSVALLPGLGIGRPQMGGIDNHGRNGTTDTIVHAMSEHIILTGGVEVKCAGVG